MKYWDSSALVPLVVEESLSRHCRRLLKEDSAITVWTLSRTEIISAIHRKERAGELASQAVRAAIQRVALLETGWTEVTAVPAVRDRADRLLAVHSLRAADALQLAAALVLTEERPRGCPFVTVDRRLVEAAGAEGFDVEVPAP